MSIKRRNITDDDGNSAGWFSQASAKLFAGEGRRGGWRYQNLFLTAGQRYILGWISCVQGETDRYQTLNEPLAHAWLLKNDHGPSEFPAGAARASYEVYLTNTEL